MKRYITTIFIILCFISAKAQVEIFENRQHVRNNYVSTVTHWTCCVTNCSKKGHARKVEQSFFDKDGYETQRDLYITHSVPDISSFFYYDKKGNLIKKADFHVERQDTINTILYEYDDDGNLSKETQTHKHGSTVITEYEYNDKNLLILKVIKNKQGKVDEKVTYKYNKKQLIESDIFKSDENNTLKLYEKIKYTYGEEDMPVKISTYLGNGELLSENIHQYTFDGKLISEVVIHNNVTGPKSECTHFYHYEFYEHD